MVCVRASESDDHSASASAADLGECVNVCSGDEFGSPVNSCDCGSIRMVSIVSDAYVDWIRLLGAEAAAGMVSGAIGGTSSSSSAPSPVWFRSMML